MVAGATHGALSTKNSNAGYTKSFAVAETNASLPARHPHHLIFANATWF